VAQVHHDLRSRDIASEFGRWSVPGRIDWREWDGEVVVRVEASGATYLLSTLAGETVKALQQGAMHADEIAARVFADGEPPGVATAALVAAFADPAADTRDMLAVLAELEKLGLAQADFT
jgi:hypothetical protein